MHDFRQVRHYLTDEDTILVANALLSSRLDHCNSLLTSHLLVLSQTVIDTHRHLIFSKDSLGYQLNKAVSSKLPLWFISFFTVIISAILFLLSLFVEVDMTQDIADQIKGSWRFPKSINLYIN